MTVAELENKFSETLDSFGESVQAYLNRCACDADTRLALDEVARQAFHALAQTQSALIEYLESK